MRPEALQYAQVGGGGWEWSPTSSHLVLGTSNHLYGMRPDGSEFVELTGPRSAVLGDLVWAWAPDGSRVAFSLDGNADNARELFSVEPNGVGRIQLNGPTGHASYFTWSPDGSRIAYLDRGGLFSVLPNGTGYAHLHHSPISWRWAPDSKRVMFLAHETAGLRELFTAGRMAPSLPS